MCQAVFDYSSSNSIGPNVTVHVPPLRGSLRALRAKLSRDGLFSRGELKKLGKVSWSFVWLCVRPLFHTRLLLLLRPPTLRMLLRRAADVVFVNAPIPTTMMSSPMPSRATRRGRPMFRSGTAVCRPRLHWTMRTQSPSTTICSILRRQRSSTLIHTHVLKSKRRGGHLGFGGSVNSQHSQRHQEVSPQRVTPTLQPRAVECPNARRGREEVPSRGPTANLLEQCRNR